MMTRMMEIWWQALNLELQIFYGIGIIALLALVLQMALVLFGGMDDSGDLGDGGHHEDGLGIFSIRGITAFFLGFGWTGIILLKAGHSLALAIVLGLFVGSVLMLGLFFVMRSMMRLQSSGTLNYANAIGEIATVYVTVPGVQKGGGQVEVMIQGRLAMAEALYRGEISLSPGTKVRVIETIGRSTLVVEPI
jgi:membrane protein implicated in regulation of membrane protease activity